MRHFRVMLAQKMNEKKLSFPVLVSPKLDGIRAQFYKGEFYTRNQKFVRGLTHLKRALHGQHLREQWFDGELLIPDMLFQKSSGEIRSYRETPHVHYYIFDAPYVDEPQHKRLEFVKAALQSNYHDKIHIVPHVTANNMAEVMEWYKRYRAMGFEGAMVKAMDGLYEGKRSSAWMKLKEVETYDVECTGFFRGQGRLSNTLGGITVELDGVPIRVGSGFSDAERDLIWKDKEKYRGMVCEVSCQELTPDGSMRHPRFITWRYDL